MNELFLKQVISDVSAYAKEYKCDLYTAIVDWEGDGPSGSWGLNPYEQSIVAKHLGIAEEFSTEAEEY